MLKLLRAYLLVCGYRADTMQIYDAGAILEQSSPHRQENIQARSY